MLYAAILTTALLVLAGPVLGVPLSSDATVQSEVPSAATTSLTLADRISAGIRVPIEPLARDLTRDSTTSLSASNATAWTVDASQLLSSSSQIREAVRRLHSDYAMPLLITNVDVQAQRELWTELGVPIRPVNAVAVDTVHSSALILIDTFHDVHGGKHYRIIRVPDEVRREVHVGEDHDDHQLVLGQRSCRSPVVAIRSDGRRVMNATWHAQVSPSSTIMPIDDILNDLNDYLEHCGGRREDSMRIAECWHFMNREARTADDRASVRSMLPPGEGAVWREIVETTYHSTTVVAGSPFPFGKEQRVGHRLNLSWYIYIQAPPFTPLYYVFLLVNGMHNANAQTTEDEAVGFYLSNVDVELKATGESGKGDEGAVYWIKSAPGTTNTKHRTGQSESVTDTQTLTINIGFKGENVTGGIKFKHYKSFSASFSERRELTDWSVVENTDPGSSLGRWKYHQQWPVDMLENGLWNFAQNWEEYYEKPWNGCRVKSAPALSRYAIGTHNSMVWAIDPRLRSEDGRQLPVRFTLALRPTIAAHTCETYNGHHTLFQRSDVVYAQEWDVNVADLNNIRWT